MYTVIFNLGRKMDLKKDKQKIYSIEAEYYKEHMRETSQSSVSQKLNTIIQALMLVLLIIVSFFAYKMIKNNVSGSTFPTHSTKNYVEELAVNKTIQKPVEEKIKQVVMGVSVLSSEVEEKPTVVPVAIKVVESVQKEKTPAVVTVEKEVKIIESEKVQNVVAVIEKKEKSIERETDILSEEYLREMENALLDSI